MTSNPTSTTALTTNPGIRLIFASNCELGMVDRYCLHIFSSYEIPTLTLREASDH